MDKERHSANESILRDVIADLFRNAEIVSYLRTETKLDLFGAVNLIQKAATMIAKETEMKYGAVDTGTIQGDDGEEIARGDGAAGDNKLLDSAELDATG